MSLVAPSFHPDAVSAELMHQEDGWFLWFVLGQARVFDFITKESVREDIGDRAVKHERSVVRYLESRLKSAGYEGVTHRPNVVGRADTVAVWDFKASS